jgi:hypothetical protein
MWASLLIQTALAVKVYRIPETGTPPFSAMMQAVGLNRIDGDIYYFGGRDNDTLGKDQLFAFNYRSKTWRYFQPVTSTKPGND